MFRPVSVFAFAILGLSLTNGAFAGPYSTYRKNVSPFNKACSLQTATSFTKNGISWTRLVLGTCDTTTVGGTVTYVEHHDRAIKCTWAELNPGTWSSEPGGPSSPISVTQEVAGSNGNYADCSGWDQPGTTGASPPPIPFTPADHQDAPYGYGKFMFSMKYESTSTVACLLDDNSGIGQEGKACGTAVDPQNPKHNSGTTLTGAALRTCLDPTTNPATVVGTELIYSFACGNGVSVTGYLTLVPPGPAIYAGPNGIAETTSTSDDLQVVGVSPTKLPRNTIVIAPGVNGTIETPPSGDDVQLDGVTQPNGIPAFTGCTPARVAAGKCTMVLGGLPLNRKGTAVDITACNAIFRAADVSNALNTNQVQHLGDGQLLLYKEVSSEGSCDAMTGLPTTAGLTPPDDYLKGIAKEAFGRYCQSDFGRFSDNKTDNIFLGESTSTNEGFDNELRICGITTTQKVAHQGDQDVERISAGVNEIVATQDNQTTMNISCQGSDGNDSARVQITIPDQAVLLNTDVQTAPAPTLEGVVPVSVTQNFVISTDPLRFGLRLEYRRCGDQDPTTNLAAAIRANPELFPVGTSPITLTLRGQTVEDPTLSFPFAFTNTFSVNINGW